MLERTVLKYHCLLVWNLLVVLQCSGFGDEPNDDRLHYPDDDKAGVKLSNLRFLLPVLILN